MIQDNNLYTINYGKYKGRRFLVVPMVHFEYVVDKLIKRAVKKS